MSKTMTIYVVVRDLGYDGQTNDGFYVNKDLAKDAADHLNAIQRNIDYDQWIRYRARSLTGLEFKDWLIQTGSFADEYRVDEETLILEDE